LDEARAAEGKSTTRRVIKGIPYTLYFETTNGRRYYRVKKGRFQIPIGRADLPGFDDRVLAAHREIEGRGYLGKLQYNTPKPLFFPVWDGSPIYWPWPSILITYSAIKEVIRNGMPEYYHENRKRTIIMVESGGYSESKPESQESLILDQAKIFPDVAFTYDTSLIPFKHLKDKEKERRFNELTTSQVNHMYRINRDDAKMAKKLRNKLGMRSALLAVIHARSIKDEVENAKKLYDLGFRMFGIRGGFKQTRAEDEIKPAVFAALKDALPDDVWLHGLGIGSIDILKEIGSNIDSFDNSELITQTSKGYVYDEGQWLDVSTKKRRGKEVNPKTIKNRLDAFAAYGYDKATIDKMDRLSKSDNESERVSGSDMVLRLVNFFNYTDYLKRELWKIK
jgi:CRISPR/Cas system CSM-associated protein Csm2 small subunit